MKRPLLIIAHPDDEVICFWWALQNFKPDIVCCTSDANNPVRKKWARRKEGLAALCAARGLQYRCLDNSSGFCRVDGRGQLLTGIERDIVSAAAEMGEHDAVITHNPWGEYGHTDHIWLHSVVVRQYGDRPIYMSDIFYVFDGMWAAPVNKRKPLVIESFANDEKQYDTDADHYRGINMWTWGNEISKGCGLWSM